MENLTHSLLGAAIAASNAPPLDLILNPAPEPRRDALQEAHVH